MLAKPGNRMHATRLSRLNHLCNYKVVIDRAMDSNRSNEKALIFRVMDSNEQMEKL